MRPWAAVESASPPPIEGRVTAHRTRPQSVDPWVGSTEDHLYRLGCAFRDHNFTTLIVVNRRVFAGADDRLYAFRLNASLVVATSEPPGQAVTAEAFVQSHR